MHRHGIQGERVVVVGYRVVLVVAIRASAGNMVEVQIHTGLIVRYWQSDTTGKMVVKMFHV